jgi:Domain of unknown function (DUF4939)
VRHRSVGYSWHLNGSQTMPLVGTSKAKLWDPNQFDGLDLKKLQGFLLQCKLNFRAKPESFRDDSAKINYILSLLKGTALDYFEPFLVEDLANEPGWLTNFEYFTKELYIYFGLYDQQAKAKIELEQLVMKDNHKATKFFCQLLQNFHYAQS